MKVTLAATQFACSANAAGNLDRAEHLVREAAGKGAQVILLQELFRWSKGNAEDNGAGMLVATGIPSRFRRGGGDAWD